MFIERIRLIAFAPLGAKCAYFLFHIAHRRSAKAQANDS